MLLLSGLGSVSIIAFQYLLPVGVPAEFCHTLKAVTAGRNL